MGLTYISIDTFIENLRKLQLQVDSLYGTSRTQLSKAQSICSLMRHKVYDGANWIAAAGPIDTNYCSVVSNTNPSLFNDMSNPSLKVIVSSGVEFEPPHFAAALDAYLSASTLPAEWSGWAGDLGTLIKYVQTISGNSSDYNTLASLALRWFLDTDGPFSKADFISDIDAENIAVRLRSGNGATLYDAIFNYYKYGGASRRCSEFVSRREGSEYFMNNIMGIMENQALYLGLAASPSYNYIRTAPSFDQIYSVTGAFTSYVLKTLRSE